MPFSAATGASKGRIVSKIFTKSSVNEFTFFRPPALDWRSVHRLSNGRQLHTTLQRCRASDVHHPPPSVTTAAAELVQVETPKPRRSLRVYLYIAGFLLIGAVGGQFARAVVLPPPLPVPDSAEDEYLLSKIRKDIGKLPLVKELRAHRGEWLEYEAYMDKPPEEAAPSLTAGAMHGTRALGAQRIFYNKKERRLINVVFVGGGLAGWPGVVHGGAIATLLLENMERVVNGPELQWGQESGGGSGGGGQMVVRDIDLTYRKPSHANGLYVIRAAVDESSLPLGEQRTMNTRLPVIATLENALAGVVCVEGRGFCSASHVVGGSDVGSKGEALPGSSLWGSWSHMVSQFSG